MNTREPLGHIEGSHIGSLTWNELGLSSPTTTWFPARHAEWDEPGTLEDDESFQTTLAAAIARIQVQAHYTGHAATPAPDTCGICAHEDAFSTRS